MDKNILQQKKMKIQEKCEENNGKCPKSNEENKENKKD